MEAFVCLTEPFSRLRGNIKSPKAEGHNHEAVASGLILPLCNFHPHQSCTCFMVIFTGSWLLSYHSGTSAAVAYNTILPHSCCGCLGLRRCLDPYRDQGGPTANYTDHVHTEIAADNYISEQTGEQSIVLAIEQRWPVLSAPFEPDEAMTSNPIHTCRRRWHSCCGQNHTFNHEQVIIIRWKINTDPNRKSAQIIFIFSLRQQINTLCVTLLKS